MTPTPTERAWPELRDDLDRAEHHAGAALRRRRGARALRRALRTAPLLLLIVPSLAVLMEAMRWIAGREGLPAGVPLLAGLTVAVPIVFTLLGVVAARAGRIERRTALAAADLEMDDEDRLVTADEFLAHEARTGFMEAALADAAPYAKRARETHFTPEPRPGTPGLRTLLGAGGAIALIALALWMGAWPGRPAPLGADPALVAARDAALAPRIRTEEEPSPPAAAVPRRPAPESRARDRAPDEPAGSPPDDTKPSDEARPSEGRTRSGRPADAQSAGDASDARAAPTNQEQKSRTGAKAVPAPRKKPPKRKPPSARDPGERKTRDESGATAGRGASGGSGRNPAASEWSSRDQVRASDDEEVEDEEDVEDEEEEQESRGGVQPSLRDRRPPVSRDLRIGFGSQPNPDANGRGGPSAQKKSRGTASLVLGVPIPDRVKGQPNPGRTKVTQERVEPKEESSAPAEAAARRPREALVGHLHRPDLSPWMRDIVRTYFLTVRNRQNSPPRRTTPQEEP